jgi:hypothetical protein
MTLLAAVVLPPTELVDDDLLGPILGHDGRLDLGARDRGLPHLDRAVALATAHEQHLADGDLVTRVARELLDPKVLALQHPVLLSA